MAAPVISTDSSLSLSPQPHEPGAERTLVTVKVYTRHNRNCPKRDRSDWARCSCVKWLYVYRDGKYRLVSAKTRSWEKAEQKAREIRDSFDPIRRLQRQLEAKAQADKSQLEIASATEQFLKEVARLNRAEATEAKYKLTLARLLQWCATQETPLTLLGHLDVATTRRWIHSWGGAPTSIHNQHQRAIAFFNFCIEQGWIKENPAKKIKKVPRKQEETLPFTRQQLDALIEATYYYDSRGTERNGHTTNSRRVRAYLRLLRWSGLRAGDAACLPKSNLRSDDSLFLYQAKPEVKLAPLSTFCFRLTSLANCARYLQAASRIQAISFGVVAANGRARSRTGKRFLPRSCLRHEICFLSSSWNTAERQSEPTYTCSETPLPSNTFWRGCRWMKYRAFSDIQA